MPSPFIGLTKPAASPIATQPGPCLRTQLIGNRHARGLSMYSPSDHDSLTSDRYWSSNVLRLSFLKPFIVLSAPTPMLTVPSPAGNIHPYPGTGVPCSSRKLKHASKCRSAWRGLGTYARIARPKVSFGSRTAPSIFAAAPWAPDANTTNDARISSAPTTTPTARPSSISGSASLSKRTSAPAAIATSSR